MFEKRLFSLVPQATPYIMASVLFKWIALMANITVMWVLARILGGIVETLGQIVTAAFGQRRKTLRNALSAWFTAEDCL